MPINRHARWTRAEYEERGYGRAAYIAGEHVARPLWNRYWYNTPLPPQLNYQNYVAAAAAGYEYYGKAEKFVANKRRRVSQQLNNTQFVDLVTSKRYRSGGYNTTVPYKNKE